VKQDDGKDGNEAQAVNLGDIAAAGGGAPEQGCGRAVVGSRVQNNQYPSGRAERQELTWHRWNGWKRGWDTSSSGGSCWSRR
jgi:hypothetical protein